MKFTSAVLLLVASGLASAADKKDGKYEDWKKAAESTNTLATKKHKSLSDLVDKLESDPKLKVQPEVTKVKKELDKVLESAKIITDLNDSEFKTAKTEEEKKKVATKAAETGVKLAGEFLEFENTLKKASLEYTKSFVEKEGHLKVLEFLKGKVGNLEKDGFLASSLLAAAALSAVAIGATFN